MTLKRIGIAELWVSWLFCSMELRVSSETWDISAFVAVLYKANPALCVLLQSDSYKDPTSGCVGAYLLMYAATYQSKTQIPIRHAVQTEIMQGGLYHPKPGWQKKKIWKKPIQSGAPPLPPFLYCNRQLGSNFSGMILEFQSLYISLSPGVPVCSYRPRKMEKSHSLFPSESFFTNLCVFFSFLG